MQELLDSMQQPKRIKAEGLWVATGQPDAADAVLFPALFSPTVSFTPTVGLTPTLGAFSPLGGITPTALLAEGIWGAPDGWAHDPVPRPAPPAEAEDEALLLFAGHGQGWE